MASSYAGSSNVPSASWARSVASTSAGSSARSFASSVSQNGMFDGELSTIRLARPAGCVIA